MSNFPDTRYSLIQRLATEDHDSWREFVSLYEMVIYRVARRTGLQHADALDVTQEAFARVHRHVHHWDQARTDGRFRNWLHRLTVNASIDILRGRRARTHGECDSAVAQQIGEIAEPSAEECSWFRLEYRRVLFDMVATRVRADVSETAWQVFWLASVDSIPATTIAERLNLSIGSVYAHKCRVLSKLRDCVSSLNADDTLEGDFRS